MSKQIQYCTCKINLAGQNCHTVIYDPSNPVTWPEIQVLQALHGDENVMDIMPVGLGQVWPSEEKNRLISIYGHRIVEACFPGRAFRMDYMMTEDISLPSYEDGKPAYTPSDFERQKPNKGLTSLASNGNGDDDEDDGGEDEVAKAQASLEPIFKPSPRGRRTPLPQHLEHKDAG